MTYFKHGLSRHPINRRWYGMKQRCYNVENKAYKHYGGRGITVCDEWKDDFMAFYIWSITNGWKDGLSIDRIDNDRGYSPDNCRWTTTKVQGNNKRTNTVLNVFGEKKTISEWADDPRCKVSHNTLSKRICFYGMDAQTAVTQPMNRVEKEAFGEVKVVEDWVKDSRCVVSKTQLWRRINAGWNFEKALITPKLLFHSKAKGVHFDKKSNKWEAGLGTGKFRHLGKFDTEEEAIVARKEAEMKVTGAKTLLLTS